MRRWGSLPRISVRDFYVLRFARIAPLLLSLLAVLSLLHLARIGDFVVRASTGGLGRALLAALTFHVNVLEARRGYLPGNWDVLWSLSVEETFYLFFPVVCLLLARGKVADCAVCCIGVIAWARSRGRPFPTAIRFGRSTPIWAGWMRSRWAVSPPSFRSPDALAPGRPCPWRRRIRALGLHARFLPVGLARGYRTPRP